MYNCNYYYTVHNQWSCFTDSDRNSPDDQVGIYSIHYSVTATHTYTPAYSNISQSPCINIFEYLNEYVIFICDMAFEQLPIAQMNKCNSRKPKIFSFSLTAVTVDLFIFLTNVQYSQIVKSHTVAALW